MSEIEEILENILKETSSLDPKIQTFLISSTKEILEKEKLDCIKISVKPLVSRTYYQHTPGKIKETGKIQYGEEMFANILSKKDPGKFYYVKDNSIFKLSHKLLSVETQVISVMLEEIAHALSSLGERHHGYSFYSSFKYLWNKYYLVIVLKLRILLGIKENISTYL
uniref:Uncharacterized protein n=1 Tax=viral metagenome TaxID=1070528 RepID=A0A6H1ZMB0_9ZZZZ